MNSKIIGISGIGGAGKSTFASYLSKLLKATLVSWDDFDAISRGPQDYVEWYEQGKNYEAWDYIHLAQVLGDLKQGKIVQHPTLNQALESTKYIIFDAPLGRLHTQTGQYIDVWVHLDVPLHIALARRAIRDFSGPDKTKEELLTELKYYLTHSRKLFLAEELKNNADLIVDGMLTVEEQANQIVIHLRA